MTNIALVGCGYWGKNYVDTLRDIDDVNVKYICDLKEENLAPLRKKLPNSLFFHDYKDILKYSDIDGVIIATPTATHFKIAKDFLEAGKNVLVEKPLTNNSKDAKILCDIADKNNLILMVGHIFKYNPAIVKIKELIDSGELGELRYIESRRVGLGPIRQDVSVLWDLATHDVYISNFLVGSTPQKVSCIGISHNKNIDDITNASLVYSNGVFSTIYANWGHPVKERKLYVGGTKKAILFDDVEPVNKIIIFDKGVTYTPSVSGFSEFVAATRDGDVHIPKIQNKPPLKEEIEHFLRCISKREACKTDGKEGLETVRVLESAEMSRKRGGVEICLGKCYITQMADYLLNFMIDEELLNEASEFLSIPKEEILRGFEEASKKYPGFLKWTHISEEEWLKKNINQSDEKEVAKFYQETPNYIFELIESHSTSDKKRLVQKAIEVMKSYCAKKVADYGAGIGQDSIMRALEGMEATAVDLPGRTFDFAKFRFRKRGLNIKAIDIIPGETPLKEKYDAITCFEVIQHLPNPEKTIEHFYEHLNEGGLLLLTARFKGNYALALKENERYEGNFKKIIEDRGFKQIEKIHMWGPEGEKGKYLDVYKK